ncbi:MAG: hypothetical protein RIS21_236 [Planctomycetota bacterium]|jgi:hypothetical protein
MSTGNPALRDPISEARAQGAHRPLALLATMTADGRREIASILDVPLGSAHGDRFGEAWLLIATPVKGLQARSEGVIRAMIPLAGPRNWWEILLVAGKRIGLDPYPGLSERDVERMHFERVAELVARGLDVSEHSELEAISRSVPAFRDALARLGLSDEGRLFVLAAIHRIARVAGDLVETDPTARTVAFLRRALDRAGLLPSISRSLRLLQHHVPVIAAAWGSMIVVRGSLPTASWPLHVALAAIHLHAAVEDGQEEVDQLRQ